MTPNRFIADAHRELAAAQNDVFNILLDFNPNRPEDLLSEISQAKRRLVRATSALTMLENAIPKRSASVEAAPQ